MNNYVGFWRRFVAYLIDAFLVGSFFMMFSNTLTVGTPSYSNSPATLISFVVSGIYLILFWGFQDGQTLGNRLLKIKVINEDGTKLSVGGALLRYVGFVVSSIILGLGFIWVAFDKKKQGLHDKIAKTVVVSTGAPNILLVVAAILGLGFIYGIFLAGSAYKIYKNMNLNDGNTNTARVSTLTDNGIRAMSIVAFSKANEQRTSRGLNALKMDSRLCAYAQRRIEQLDKLGKLDDGKGFYEDTANKEMQNAYFSENPTTGEIFRTMTDADFEESGITSMVESWSRLENSNMLDKGFQNGCIRADKNFMVFILGGTGK